jgi:hypothetical protein
MEAHDDNHPHDVEPMARRAAWAAWSAVVGIIATGGSTLAMISSADRSAHAVVVWAVGFFASAQVAAVCAALLVLQVLRIRSAPPTPAESALLCRRALVGLAAAALAMFSVGAALPGHGSMALVLGGPVVGLTAAGAVLWARAGIRRLAGASDRVDHSPFSDLRAITGLRVPVVGPVTLAIVAAVGALARDRGEIGSTRAGSLAQAAIEALLVLAAYAVLRGPLGLRRLRPSRG